MFLIIKILTVFSLLTSCIYSTAFEKTNSTLGKIKSIKEVGLSYKICYSQDDTSQCKTIHKDHLIGDHLNTNESFLHQSSQVDYVGYALVGIGTFGLLFLCPWVFFEKNYEIK